MLLAGSRVVEGFVEVGKLLRHALARCFDVGMMRSRDGCVGGSWVGSGEEFLDTLAR